MRLIVLLLALFPCAARGVEPLRAGHFIVQFREDGGARVTLGGVPLIRGSSVQLHAPDWKKGYYSSSNSPRKVQVSESERTITVGHVAEKHVKFAVTETYRIVDDDELEVTLSGRLDSDVPAQLEWAIGYVNAFALYGGGYSGGDEVSPVVPQAPIDDGKPAVVEAAGAIRLVSRAGSITCGVRDGAPRLTLLDGRLAAQRWWAAESPTLWLGCTGIPVKPGEPFELRAVLTFEPAPAPRVAEPVTQAVELHRTPRAYEPPERPFHVVPKPKRMTLRNERILLPDQALIGVHPKSVAATNLLSRQLNQRFGLRTAALDVSNFFPNDETDIQFLEGPADTTKPEGYTIHVSRDGVRIRAIDPAGFRYAVQTLLQLARPMPEGSGAYVPACEVEDEPSLAFRGVHLFPGRDSLDFHRRLIENVIARHKFNHVVLECEYTQWDSARGVWVDFSVPKDQIRQYVQMLRENGLEPIPLVQSLGHCGWMFKNDQNLDLAEDPEVPRAYDATNAKTYEFIDRVYEEALDLFGRVKYFHIGHDEVTLFGSYPNRETSKQWGVTRLFLHDIDHWRQFFEPRGVRLMMWGDMLLAPEEIKDGAAFSGSLDEARARRAAVPKDTVICDWHYDALKRDDYPSLKIFHDAGFTPTVASTWFKPMNIHGFAEAARRNGAWGLLQTTWAGYNLDEGALDRELKQFAAYVLAAEYAWSADSPPPDELPWRADEVLVQAMEARSAPASPQAGYVTSLPGTVARRDGLGAIDRIDGIRFKVGDRATVLDGALVSDDVPLPRSVTFKIAATAREIAFLHATEHPAERGERVGEYTVRYSDGASERVPLTYGQNIRALGDPAIAREAVGARIAQDDAGLTVAARVLVWTNPHPDKPVESVTFSTDHPYASPVLLALSGIGGDAK